MGCYWAWTIPKHGHRMGIWGHTRRTEHRGVARAARKVTETVGGLSRGSHGRRDLDGVGVVRVCRNVDAVALREKSVESLNENRIAVEEHGDPINDARCVDSR